MRIYGLKTTKVTMINNKITGTSLNQRYQTPDLTLAPARNFFKRLQQAGASGIQISKDEAERLKFWSGRKNAFPAAGRLAADYYCMDGTIPRRHIATLLKRIQGMEENMALAA